MIPAASRQVQGAVGLARLAQAGALGNEIACSRPQPRYEADVFIGFDPETKDYIAHWLDRFGAPGARVVARGERQNQRLVLNFPYTEGAFRDTLTWHPASVSWSLLLESQHADGTWSTFASYSLTRGVQH